MQYNITYRKKDGGWQYIISFKENGKWKQKSKQGFRTRGLAKVAADKRLEGLKEVIKHIDSTYDDITFKEFIDTFLNSEKRYKSYNTLDAYKHASNHFSNLNNISMSKIKYMHIKTSIDKMLDKGLSEGSINTYIKRMKALFNHAIDPYRIIKNNPMEGVKLLDSKTKDEIKALNKWELDGLLGKIKQRDLYLATLVASSCGLRLGEILGLTWADINYVNSTLEVNKQWKTLDDNKNGFGKLKTKNSYRTVPIPPKLIYELKEYKKVYPTDKYNRIFLYNRANSLGSKLAYNYKQLGYDNSVHDMRHTYATLLIANGVDFKTVARLLGDTVEMVMKVYSHVTDDMMDNATNAVNNIFK